MQEKFRAKERKLYFGFVGLEKAFDGVLSKFSLVLLLAWHPSLHTPYVSSPNHCLLFAVYAHTIAACFAIVLTLCNLSLVSLSTLYFKLLSCSLTPHRQIVEKWLMTTIGVSGWMFLLPSAHPGCPTQKPESHKMVVCVPYLCCVMMLVQKRSPERNVWIAEKRISWW